MALRSLARKFCYAIHADEPDPELDIQDWEAMPTGLDSDDIFSEVRFEQLQQYIELCDKYDTDAVDAYLNIFQLDQLDQFEERYQGEYDSEEAYAEYLISECYDLDRLMAASLITSTTKPTHATSSWKATLSRMAMCSTLAESQHPLSLGSLLRERLFLCLSPTY